MTFPRSLFLKSETSVIFTNRNPVSMFLYLLLRGRKIKHHAYLKDKHRVE
jgi:hypothetical protein